MSIIFSQTTTNRDQPLLALIILAIDTDRFLRRSDQQPAGAHARRHEHGIWRGKAKR